MYTPLYNPCAVDADPKEADAVTRAYKLIMRGISNQLLQGNYDLNTWKERMSNAIRQAYTHQAVAGTRGNDLRELTPDDRARLEAEIADQVGYLDYFSGQIADAQANGKPLDFVTERAQLYAETSEVAYWRQAAGHIGLPAMPRDMSTPCLWNCKCEWHMDCSEPGIIRARWVLGDADHCPVCVQRSIEWADLVIKSPSNPGRAIWDKKS